VSLPRALRAPRGVLAWLAVACLALAGCATPRPQPGAAQVAGVEALSRTGRFAVRVEEAGGRQDAVQGGFSWRDDGRRLTLDLVNPLGSTLARVEAAGGMATLRRSDGSVTQAPGADALVEDVLGSPIPVAGLRDWMRGRTADQPPAGALARDPEGRPSSFTQGGWEVRLSRYDAQGPLLLSMERHDAGRRITVRLVADPS